MPLDAVYLTSVAAELRSTLAGTKIDKIHQPARDEIIIALRSREGSFRLLLSANPARPRAPYYNRVYRKSRLSPYVLHAAAKALNRRTSHRNHPASHGARLGLLIPM